ncbi:MAG TPA: arginine deiminase-related protein, partial [Ktedonobacteraceae bacterium]|nr:arginine deiminase-related protein [Ktedonobacteraceae bacterium]
MTRRYGCQDMVSPLRTVLVKRPDNAFAVADPAEWHYNHRPNLEIAQQEHDALTAILREADAEVLYHDEALPDHADAIFAFDPSLVTDAGAIILRMGKDKRRGEEEAMARCYEQLGIPILATLHGEA